MLYVKKANVKDIEKEWAFVRDMPEDENGLTNEWSGTLLRKMMDTIMCESKKQFDEGT